VTWNFRFLSFLHPARRSPVLGLSPFHIRAGAGGGHFRGFRQYRRPNAEKVQAGREGKSFLLAHRTAADGPPPRRGDHLTAGCGLVLPAPAPDIVVLE